MNKRTILTIALTMAIAASAMASQPLRRTVSRQTTDGRTVLVERRGGPDFSWWQSADGQRFTMERDARLAPVTTDIPTIRRAMNASTENGLGSFGTSGMGVVRSLGTPRIPVIMVAFSDKDFLPANDKEKVTRFLNEEGYKDERYAVGSVKDYFRHSSYGHFVPHFEVVAKVTLPNDYKYYGAHSGSATDARRMEAVREAVRLAEEQGVDFSTFATDGHAPLVSILHAGPGEQEDYGSDYGDYLWAHFSQSTVVARSATIDSYLMTNETMRDFDSAGNLTNEYMTGIGTFCHEFSHALGLPDMYDVDGSSGGTGQTPGFWDVMDYQFMYDGFRPMEYSAYERSMMGWIEVEDLTADKVGHQFDIDPLQTSDATDADVMRYVAYRIVNPQDPNEYFIMENRRKNTFYQQQILGEGMLLWHIAYDSGRWASNRVNVTGSKQHVRVVPADGQWQSVKDANKTDADGKRYTFTGDLFPGYAAVTRFDRSLDDFFTGQLTDVLTEITLGTDGRVSFVFGEQKTVGLDSPVAESHDSSAASSAYDLQGRPVNVNAPGFYILDGKKIIK